VTPVWTIIIISVLVIAGLVVAFWTLFHPTDWAVKRVGNFYPGVVFRVTTGERAVALTIDDAPHPDVTPGILNELRKHGARATHWTGGRSDPGSRASARPATR